MLKWIAPKGNQPRSASRPPNHDKSNSNSPRLTDDPLATINVDDFALNVKRNSDKAPKRRSEPEHVYSVTRWTLI